MFGETAVRILPFEPCYQNAVVELFAAGLTTSYADKSETIQACQKKFVSTKISPGGDMADIAASFMADGDDSCRHFWVAVDSSNTVVGHVGLVPSTYAASESNIYAESRGIDSSTVGELVRMSVHKDVRGKGVGQMLCKTLEAHAVAKGMRRVALSTLAEMDLAIALYQKCGYQPAMETAIDTSGWLGPGNWEPLIVAHFIKDVGAI